MPKFITAILEQVAETCQLALQRIERQRGSAAGAAGNEASPYASVDPMLAAPADTPMDQVSTPETNASAKADPPMA